MLITGERVVLRPMTAAEAPLLYRWATKSDGAVFWYGELTGEPVPSYEKFLDSEFPAYYFDDSQPQKGRAYAMLVGGRPVGEINYNEINTADNSTELDIIIASSNDMSRGYGSDAVRTLTAYLSREMGVRLFKLETATSNPRAIKAYQKAGFKKLRTYIKNGVEWQLLEMHSKGGE